MKKLAIGIGGSLGLIVVAGLLVVGIGTMRLTAKWRLPAETLALPTDPAVIAVGRRLASINQCTSCHGDNLAGINFIEGMPFMDLPAPNLTAGAGGVGKMPAAKFEQAIRHGVGADGRGLLIMPSETFAGLTDEDVSALIGYIRSLPAVDSDLVERRIGPIGRFALLTGADELISARTIDHEKPHTALIDTGDPVARGKYLAGQCVLCHGESMSGGPLIFDATIWAANLTPDDATGLGQWTRDMFARVLREGKKPDGTEVTDAMPWQGFASYTDEEIGALWEYLRSVPVVVNAPPVE